MDESDITELEKQYWLLKGSSETGKFDLQTFKKIVTPPFPETLLQGLLTLIM